MRWLLTPLLVLALAGDAHASLRAYASGTGLVSDGRRWTFWHDATGVRMFDEQRGVVRRMRGLGACASRWKMEHVVPASGLSLVVCATETDTYPYNELTDNRIFVPAHRRARRLRGAEPTDYFVRIGRRWVEGYSPGEESRDTTSVLVNWHTGERRDVTSECWDLNRVEPVEVRDGRCFDGASVQRDGGYRLRWLGDPQVTGDHLDLFRGSRHVKRLNRRSCGTRVEVFCSPQLGGGWVTFARHREVVAYDIASRRTRRWRAQVKRVVHTRRYLFTAHGGTIHRARL